MFALLWLIYFTGHGALKVHSCCSRCQNLNPFHSQIILHVCVEHILFIYSFISWWTLVLLPHFSCHEWYLCQHGCANAGWSPCFQFLWVYIREWNGWVSYLTFWETDKLFSILVPSFFFFLTFPSAVHKGFNFSISSPILVFHFFFFFRHNSHSNGCDVVSRDFDFCFTDD